MHKLRKQSQKEGMECAERGNVSTNAWGHYNQASTVATELER